MKRRVLRAPLFLVFRRGADADTAPIALAKVYLALQQGTVDG